MRSLRGDAIHCFGPVAVSAQGPSGQPDDAHALCASKSNFDMQIANPLYKFLGLFGNGALYSFK
jgi:hypothetical protein